MHSVLAPSKERQNIQLPYNEVVKFDPDMQIGDRIDRLWVMSVGDRSAHGTLREDYVLNPEAPLGFEYWIVADSKGRGVIRWI